MGSLKSDKVFQYVIRQINLRGIDVRVITDDDFLLVCKECGVPWAYNASFLLQKHFMFGTTGLVDEINVPILHKGIVSESNDSLDLDFGEGGNK